jgi:hypothetical protein
LGLLSHPPQIKDSKLTLMLYNFVRGSVLNRTMIFCGRKSFSRTFKRRRARATRARMLCMLRWLFFKLLVLHRFTVNWYFKLPVHRYAYDTFDRSVQVLQNELLKVNRSKLGPQIGFLEKRLRNGWRKRQVTLVVSHRARP